MNLHCSVQFKRLAHFLSLFLSIIMTIYLLVTSSLLADLYRRYCDQDFGECGDDERNFLTIPLFGYLTMIGWVRQSVHMCASYACDVQEFTTNYSVIYNYPRTVYCSINILSEACMANKGIFCFELLK